MDTKQRTFTVVPARPGNADPPAPQQQHGRILTSKQLEKLYKQTKRTKRLTRLEQLEADRREQERIRRELAEEKKKDNEAARKRKKAQQVKEKQRAREEAAREERRRKGEAPVWCRPSQGTLARFFRGNGGLKKRDALGVVVGEKAQEEDGSDDADESAQDEVVEEESVVVGRTVYDDVDDDCVELQRRQSPEHSPDEPTAAWSPAMSRQSNYEAPGSLWDGATPGVALVGLDTVSDDYDPFGDEPIEMPPGLRGSPSRSPKTTPYIPLDLTQQSPPLPLNRQPSLAPAAPILSALELDMLFGEDIFQPTQPKESRMAVAMQKELELDSDGLFDDEPVLTPSPKPAPKPPDEVTHSPPNLQTPAPAYLPPSTQAFLFDYFDDFFSHASQEIISPSQHEPVVTTTSHRNEVPRTKQPSTPSHIVRKETSPTNHRLSPRALDSAAPDAAASLIFLTQDFEFTFQDLQEITQRGAVSPDADISAFSLALSLTPPSPLPSSQRPTNRAPQAQCLLTPKQAPPQKHAPESHDEEQGTDEQDPEPPRFFTSSGQTAMRYIAKLRSLRTANRQGLNRWEAERREAGLRIASERNPAAKQQAQASLAHEQTPEPALGRHGVDSRRCTTSSLPPVLVDKGASCASTPPPETSADQGCGIAAVPLLAASQETDYGDFGLDGHDLEDMEVGACANITIGASEGVTLIERDFECLDDDDDIDF